MPALVPIPISSLQFQVANGTMMLVAETTAGVEVRIDVQDVVNLTQVPGGVMLTSVYDTNGDGIVDNSAALGGQAASYYLDLANMNANFSAAQITALIAALQLTLYELKSNKGIANGYVPLDSSGMIPAQYYLNSGLKPKGNWDVVTNTPVITDNTGALGDWYVVINSANPTARNLGSGAINFFDNDWVIHDGTKYVRNGNGAPAGTGITQITTDSGALTGLTVALNSTAQIAESTNRRYMTDSQNLGFDATQAGAFPASATNPVATEDYVQSIATSLTVTNEWMSPEVFQDGLNDVGKSETPVFMNTLINPVTGLLYTTGSLLAAYSLLPGSATAATWTYEDVCVESMFRRVENVTGSARMTFHDDRIYLYNQSHLLPYVSARVVKGQKWQFDFNSTLHKNISGVAKKLFKHMPANQAEAAGAYGSYAYIFNQGQFFGANLAQGSGDTAWELGAHYNSRANDCMFYGWDIGIENYFGLSMEVANCNFQANASYGIMSASGGGVPGGSAVWTGGTILNSCSNLVKVLGGQFAIQNNSLAGAAFFGIDQPTVRDAVFESTGGAANHCVLIDTMDSQLVNGCDIANLHIETESLISHVRVRADSQGIQGRVNGMYLYVSDPTIPIVETVGNGVIIMQVGFCPSRSQTFKMRHIGNTNIYYNFIQVNLADFVTLTNPANWNLNLGGVIPPSGNLTFQF